MDSEAAINDELPVSEKEAVFLELERLSVFARTSPRLPTGEDTSDFEEKGLEGQFSAGCWVHIHSLIGSPDLNGALDRRVRCGICVCLLLHVARCMVFRQIRCP